MSQQSAGGDPLERAMIDSAAGRVAAACDEGMRRAWASSTTEALWRQFADGWRATSAAARIRFVATVIAVAMATDRAMALLSPRAADPLANVVPLTVLLLSIAAGLFGDALARAFGREHQ